MPVLALAFLDQRRDFGHCRNRAGIGFVAGGGSAGVQAVKLVENQPGGIESVAVAAIVSLYIFLITAVKKLAINNGKCNSLLKPIVSYDIIHRKLYLYSKEWFYVKSQNLNFGQENRIDL